ncbi:M48 family metallopeptidase [Halodesulfurarchaeum sp.]|uniref:M48 family metallopeptidase n=1 Tax=Halodesulfurarchaeum sp. TaxID=1980530 RepID=UPI001BC22372|nr:M48 family metallopeptidase [Halodesulfurarchaeum sp.]
MLLYHAVFLLLLVGSTGFFLGLAAVNVHYGKATVRDRADWLAESLGIEAPGRVLEYQRLTTAAEQLQSVLWLVLVLLGLYSGLFGELVAVVYTGIENTLLAGIVLFIGTTIAVQLLQLPFSAFETFAIEEAFGFNEQSPRLFLRDTLVSTAIAIVLVTLVGGTVLFVIEQFPNWWWLGATGVVALFSLGSQILVPRVIMPLFYDFDPVEDSDLREAVETVFERAGFTCEDVYEMNASSRSGHSNAFFTGFGAAKRVVLFDTLIDQLEEAELQGVLAHELAHWKKGHIWQGMAVSVIQAGLLLFLAQVLMNTGWLYGMFGAPSVPAAGLILAILWLEPVFEFTQPLSNRLWLRNEREADAFAVDVMNGGESLANALATLQRENLGNPFPHPWYEAFHYQHPPIPERIRDLTAAEQNG